MFSTLNLSNLVAENRLLQKELGTFDPPGTTSRYSANAKNATGPLPKGVCNYPTSTLQSRVAKTTPEDALRNELFCTTPWVRIFNQNFMFSGLPNPHHIWKAGLSFHFPDVFPFVEIFEEEILNALSDTSKNSASGPSQTSYQVLKPLIFTLIKKCLAAGYHLEEGASDYSNPRAYRLFTLLECLE